MDIVDRMLQYMEVRQRKILLETEYQISSEELNIIVIKLLSWLKLEYKRENWIALGKKNSLKPLEIDERYPWCMNLRTLIETEKNFNDYFVLKEGKIDFSLNIEDEERRKMREKAFNNYNPQKHS